VSEGRNRSHFQIPANGPTVDPSKFLQEHFEQARKGSDALNLYREVMNNPLQYLGGRDQEKLKRVAESLLNGDLKLEPNDPLMQMLLEELNRPDRANLEPELRQKLEAIRSYSTSGGVIPPNPTKGSDERSAQDPPGSSPQTSAASNGTAVTSSQVPGLSGETPGAGQGGQGGSALNRWLLRQAEGIAKDGVLRNSPSVQRALEEFALSGSGTALGNDPDYLSQILQSALPDSWWSENAWQHLDDLESTILSHVAVPEFRFPRPGVSSADAGPEDLRISDVPGTEATLFWFLAVLALGLVGWTMYRRSAVRREGPVDRRATPGSRPVAPEAVRSLQDFVQAFEYLSLVKLGPKARYLNHRAIALELGGDESRRQQMAKHLARLYEQARYAPRPPAFSADALDAAQSELGSLASTPNA
jgi:hypothetical protein